MHEFDTNQYNQVPSNKIDYAYFYFYDLRLTQTRRLRIGGNCWLLRPVMWEWVNERERLKVRKHPTRFTLKVAS